MIRLLLALFVILTFGLPVAGQAQAVPAAASAFVPDCDTDVDCAAKHPESVVTEPAPLLDLHSGCMLYPESDVPVCDRYQVDLTQPDPIADCLHEQGWIGSDDDGQPWIYAPAPWIERAVERCGLVTV